MSKSKKEQQDNTLGIIKIFRNYSLTLPALYLCRYSIEMAIKYSLESLNIEFNKIHKLKELWKKLVDSIPKELQSGKERAILKNMGLLISKINDLDENGQRLRYAIQTSGDISQENFLWVNLQSVVYCTEKFIDQILSIDVEMIIKSRK